MWRPVLVVLLVMLLVLAVLSDKGKDLMQEKYEGLQSWYEASWDKLRDVDYNVPPLQQSPALTVTKFYENRDATLLAQHLKSRSTYKNQLFVGSVMKNGFSADLPKDCMWQDHMVVKGQHIQKLNEAKAAEPSRFEKK